ncbi:MULTISPECIES: hypothetical protein [unclassified Streptomyces]|uniref:hypothetical protein n=1 Tax=unclassified Streptomyces TaxID=2593676 RepID=UPI003814F87A
MRSREAESGTNTVTVTALDGAERLRQPAMLPRPAVPLRTLDPHRSTSGWVASCTWVVDELLRRAGIHTSPPPRTGCILYASLHGGAAPSIGQLRDLTGSWRDWSKSSAPFESCADATYLSTPTANYRAAVATVNRPAGDGLWLEGWVNTVGGSTSTAKTIRYRLEYDVTPNSGAAVDHRFLSLEINFTTGTLTVSHGTSFDPALNQRMTWPSTLATTPGTFHFGWWVQWNSAGAPMVTPQITQSATSSWAGGTATLSATPSPPGELFAVNLALSNLRAEAMQVSQLTARPEGYPARTLEGTWTKGATLGAPAFQLLSIPQVSGDAWSVITEIAKRTLATVEFDRDGFFRMQGYTRWANAPSAAAVTVSSARELGSLTVSEEIDACRNEIAVKWSNYGGHDYEFLGAKDDPVVPVAIPAGATLTRTVPTDEDRYDTDIPDLHGDLAGIGIMVLRTTASATAPYARGVAEWSVQRIDGATRLVIRNRGNATIHYHGAVLDADRDSTAARTPAPSIAAARSLTSQSAYGVQTYQHDAGPWIQTPADATALANALLAAAAFPAPLLQRLEILPDPRIDLGDVVRVIDTTGAQLDTLAWVVGNRTEGSGEFVRQVLTLRGAQSPGPPVDAGLKPDPPTRPGAPPPN